MLKQVYWTVLPERAILERSFICFMRIAERAGQLGYHYIPLNKMRTDIARENATSEFLRLSENPDDTLVMLDADHHHDTNIIETLANNDKPVVSAMAFRSNPEYPSPCFWLRDEAGNLFTPRTWEKGLIQVAVTGSGAIAIKRSVFTQLQDAGYDRMFWFYQYNPDGTRVSDEVALSQMCEAEKIPVFVDATIVTPHYFPGEIDESSWGQWLAEHPELVRREHRVSVIIPQRGRFEKLKTCLESLSETAQYAEIIVVTDIDEKDSLDNMVQLIGIERYCPDLIQHRALDKWNVGATQATGDVLVVAANDCEFKEGWLEEALKVLDGLPDGNGMVGFNDTHTDPRVSSPHFLMSREYAMKYNGGVLMPPCYDFQFADVENRKRAEKLGRYAPAYKSIVIHNHPLTESAEIDDVHQQGYMKSFDKDRVLFEHRLKEDFPIIWEPVLK